MPSRPASGVIVLGMHRSGASAAAAVLSSTGLVTPRDEDLKPLHADELKGFLEPARLVDLNQRILAVLGGDWSAPPNLTEGWQEQAAVRPLRAEASTVLREVLPPERWLWKDPRTCLTLPFWLPLIGGEPAILFVHRDPRCVARSLWQRAHLAPHTGFAIWERYLRRALLDMQGRRVVVARTDDLEGRPLDWARRQVGQLEAVGAPVAAIDEGAVAAFFASPLARLSLHVDRPVEEALSEEQERLLSLVRSLDGPHTSFSPPELPDVTPWSEALLHERRRFVEERRRSEDVRRRLKDQRERHAELRTRYHEERQRLRGKIQRLEMDHGPRAEQPDPPRAAARLRRALRRLRSIIRRVSS